MKSLIQTVVGTEVPQNMAIAVSSMAEVLVGEVVGGALDLREVERLGEHPHSNPSIRGRRLF